MNKLEPQPSAGWLRIKSAGQDFGLAIEGVHSVFRVVALTRAPLAPSWVLGLTNLRSIVLPVVCLARRLNPAESPRGVGALALVTGLGPDDFALSIDEVGDIIGADHANFTQTPNRSDFANLALTVGEVRTQTMLFPILDINAIFPVNKWVEPANNYDDVIASIKRA